MAAPTAIPKTLLQTGSFLDEVRADPTALVYFLCNVGDGDAQVVLLPAGDGGARQVLIVDAGATKKIPQLLRALDAEGIIDLAQGEDAPEPIALVVATHPHADHIRGMPEILEEFGEQIAEFWDPGYFHTISAYHSMMALIEGNGRILYAHPTSGFRRWIANVAITVLAPSVHLRNRFDSYGTEINDSSISLRLEFPARRSLLRADEDPDEHEMGKPIDEIKSRSLILGADAQTLSWSYVLVDFPYLRKSETPAAKAIAAARGDVDLLGGDVLKVAHHASKHGVNLELVERIGPTLTLVSCVDGVGQYNFPHTVAQDLIREALDPSTGDLHKHAPDHELGVFYTGDRDSGNTPLGSLALVMTLKEASMWRFGDEPRTKIDLAKARRWKEDVW